MSKTLASPNGGDRVPRPWSSWLLGAACAAALLRLAGLYYHGQPFALWEDHICHPHNHANSSPLYGKFPRFDDPFLFQPCTNTTLPPALEDPEPRASWSRLFDPDPEHWSWSRGGNSTSDGGGGGEDENDGQKDPYAGRGIYLCGYLDVPLDYHNRSDVRIARLAVAKLQVSGLARADGLSHPSAGRKSERTLVVEPGGPGGSGTSFVWRKAEGVSRRFSDSRFDVLGWDPRGVNASLPAISCFPHDADRDRWSLVTGGYREVSPSPRAQLELADAMNDAVFRACRDLYGDLPRFVSTASVARDLEEIRKALGEDELTGYLVSYGTGIGQTYANMFPASVGRMILDGTEYVRDHRLLGGFGWTALDNVTDAWRDGFLGECIGAGPERCALAERPADGRPVTLGRLRERMENLINGLIERPVPGYTGFSGPTLITYSRLVAAIYVAMYDARSWPPLARMLHELEAGNSTLAAAFLDHASWEYDPTLPSPPPLNRRPSTDELGTLVICADAYDAPLPADGLDWWDLLWANMTRDAWISGNSRFYAVFPCRHFTRYWPEPAEVYRGDLNHTLRHPVLLVAETHDPATPLRNGRRLLGEMGRNARLVVHHGYGHSSRDTSNCTDAIGRRFVLEGILPDDPETDCYADEKPYRYGGDKRKSRGDVVTAAEEEALSDPMRDWREHLEEVAFWNPKLLPP